MNKNDMTINSKISSNKTSYKYFQPILTNNTQVVSAKNDSNDTGISKVSKDIFDSKKVYKFKVNLSDAIKEEDVAPKKVKSSKTEAKDSINSVKKDEKINQEDKPVEVKILESVQEEKVDNTDKLQQKEEKANESIDEKIEKTVSEMLSELKAADNKESNKSEEKVINDDLTSKMDLPLDAIKNNEESVPFRREAPDDIKEFKVKLFLLAANAKKPVRIMVNRKKFLIGSDFEKMDCVIRNNRYISRCHARIYYESDCYFLEDAGSMNGTYINGVKLAEGLKYKLMTGDIINLADCKFEVSMR